ncbi:MAG: lytic transglycosylase domain-containing protein [Hyphomicrobiaceae bacterium]
MAGNGLFEVPQQVALALTLASNATGADFDYLMKTAARESNFRPAAVARTSSARGLFQFIEETWLHTIKEDGAKYGLEDLSEKIFRTRSGRYYVPDEKSRRKILKLRYDAKVSSLMAGAYTRRNEETVAKRIGRKPTGGELYLAHFLGASDAIRMIQLRRSNPGLRADRAFPRAARANRTIFYDLKRPRSVREVYWKLVRKYNRTGRGRNASSWSTHVVRVDAKALARRAKYIRSRSAAPKGAVPLPQLKLARNVVAVPVEPAAPVVQAQMAPVGSWLRGSLDLLTGGQSPVWQETLALQ